MMPLARRWNLRQGPHAALVRQGRTAGARTAPGCSPRGRQRDAARGFTLLEVMVSGGLLLIGLSGIVGLVGSLNELKEHQRHMTQVVHIAESTMEELLLLSSTDADLGSGVHKCRQKTGAACTSAFYVYFDSMGQEAKPTANFGPYRAEWTVTGANPIAGMRRIDLTVSWMEGTHGKTYVLTTWRL